MGLLMLLAGFAPVGNALADVPQGVSPTPKLALIIGNSAYEHVPKLPNAGNDAHDMCAAVQSLGYDSYCFTDVKTRLQMRAIIQDFEEKLSSNAVAVIYYAGHAVQIAGENYLVPISAQLPDLASLREQTVDVSYLMRQLQQTRGALKIIIVDACRDNPFESFGSVGNFSRINITTLPQNAFVLYATASEQTALEGTEHNGLLTKNLLAHLRDPGDLNDLFNRVSNGMNEESRKLGHPQMPEIRRNSTSVYCLVRCSQIEDLRKEIDELRARVAAGDLNAQNHLNDVIAQLAARQAARAVADAKSSSVPPAY